MDKSEYSFIWKIANFSFCTEENGEWFESPIIEFEDLSNCPFNLGIYPRGIDKANADYISCTLYIYSSEFCCDCEFAIIGASGKTLKIHKYNDIHKMIRNFVLRIPDFISMKEVDQDAEHISHDTLTIRFTRFERTTIKDKACRSVRTLIGADRLFFNTAALKNETAKILVTFGSEKNFELSVTRELDNLKVTISKKHLEVSFVHCTLGLELRKCQVYSQKSKHFFNSKSPSVWEFPSTELSNWIKTPPFKCKHSATLHFEFSCSSGTYWHISTPVTESSSSSNTASITRPSLQEDLGNLFDSKKLSDVKLRVEKQIIEAHKNILVARSPVFAAMFDHDMAEAQTSIVEIVDMDTGTLKLFLQFLYTDTVPEMDHEVASNLLLAAEKYQVLSLKEKCAIFLRNEISVEKVCEILTLAEAVNHVGLKEAAIELIVAHSAEVLSSTHWLTWMKGNMETATAIFTKLTLNASPSKI